MGNTLVVNSTPAEVRVALIENGAPVELHIERARAKSVVGNIYRGRVVRVLPGMQAAFVDIGLERAGFLYVNDAMPYSPNEDVAPEGENAGAPADEGAEEGREDDSASGGAGGEKNGSSGFRQAPRGNISDVLRVGQEVVVQVQKPPVRQKGARLTCHITLPGSYLVLMPGGNHLGVSRRLETAGERDRLRSILMTARSTHSALAQVGMVARTAAEGVDAETLTHEALLLAQTWIEVEASAKKGPVPRLLHEDVDLVLRATRDFLGADVERIVCDQDDDTARVSAYLSHMGAGESTKVETYRGELPIFDHFGIETELDRALGRRVWLKSGGYIVVDQTEALTTVDVNSGRFVGKSNLEDTLVQINLEAVREVAYQLRLRNIGGMIIVDFIDMSAPQSRDKVWTALAEAMQRDRAKTTLVRMSELGLVEMTRKRVRGSLREVLGETCHYCAGRGFTKNVAAVGHEVLRAVGRELATAKIAKRVLVNMQPAVADYIYEEQGSEVERLEKRYSTQIIPVAREGHHRESFEVIVGKE